MILVGLTGSKGFVGWHLRCRLFTLGLDFIEADRPVFADQDRLDDFVRRATVVVHVAGVNRAHTESEIVAGNIGLANALVEARSRTNTSFDVVYANSVKADDAGPYGESKARAGQILKEHATATRSRFADIRFPHLYGEFGAPNYNSAVTTFAHNLTRGENSTVNDGELELLHAQDASQIIIDAITEPTDGSIRPEGRPITVRGAYTLLSRFGSYLRDGTIPQLGDDFELRMFNLLRSQMWPDAYPMKLTKHADNRGAFFEVVRASGQGQTSVSTTVPGIVRGEHYHLNKVERFAVIGGDAKIRVRRLFDTKIHEFDVSGSDPVIVDMPPLCTHDIANTGDTELVTLFWSHDHFDPAQADTYPLKVTGEALPA